MNNRIISVLLGCSSFLAMADDFNPEIFNGRYSLTAESCPMFEFAILERAYVSIRDSEYANAKEILVQFYGEDASAVSVLLGHGRAQAKGTSVDVHGEVTETWAQTWLDTKTLKSVSTIIRPSVNHAHYTIKTLKLEENTLVITNEVSGKPNIAESCTLTKAD